ncbi:hypothetical protein ACIBG7_19900 [Nonomuraea sp. NPDC050328]|uniref:hypothetical protein n=1 Tax=Nonomuraea sp. NPDC050328 TaxID=3364361 RepID=UPI00379F9FD3
MVRALWSGPCPGENNPSTHSNPATAMATGEHVTIQTDSTTRPIRRTGAPPYARESASSGATTATTRRGPAVSRAVNPSARQNGSPPSNVA